MPAERLWTRAFVLLCCAQFLGYAQHFILQPTFPLYITHLGGTPFIVGVVMASFAATSMVLRPLVGYWCDRWNEAAVMSCGLVVQAASVLLCYLPFVTTVMLANSCRGMGWASLNSGGYAQLAKLAPAARRGEASGYYSGAQGSATLILPALALWLIDAPFGGFHFVFTISIALALGGAAIGWLLIQPHDTTKASHRGTLTQPWWREIFRLPEKDILLAAGLLFGLHVSLPSISAFLVLYARQIGIEQFAWFYIVSGATTLIARPLLGWASDRVGRGAAVAIGFALEALALCVIVAASNLTGMLIAGILYMSGSAMGTAATLALALERADPNRRGQAVATYSMAYPMSAGVGSLVSGGAIELVGYVWMYVFVAGLNFFGLWAIYKYWPNVK